MKPDELIGRIPENELIFSSSRSSGPGGQNVNKVNTKVEVRFNVLFSSAFNEVEKGLICRKLSNKINASGELIVTSQTERSQLKNRERALEKMYNLISKALTENPVRKSTAPTKKSEQERLEGKRKRGLTKKLRKDLDQNSGETG